MSRVTDALRPNVEQLLSAWRSRVQANRAQVDAFREAEPGDFYAPIAGLFRVDPRRRDEPALEALRGLVQSSDCVLDVGAGGGRYALPLALATREVIAIEPSDGMRRVLHAGMTEHGIDNIRVVDGRWPTIAAEYAADVVLIAHIGYDVEDIGPFVDALERAARRRCIAVLLEQAPPTQADRFWPEVHGVERAALPSLPEFLMLLLARGRLFDVRLVERGPQSYEQPDQALAWLRQQLWTRPDSPKDLRLQQLARDRLQQRDGRYSFSFEPVRVGIVTWQGG